MDKTHRFTVGIGMVVVRGLATKDTWAGPRSWQGAILASDDAIGIGIFYLVVWLISLIFASFRMRS